MNRERIEAAIELMKQATRLDMTSHQCFINGRATSVEELHACGNTACFAGYVALSPEFIKAGGIACDLGEPCYGGEYDEDAMALYFGIDEDLAYALIYGGTYRNTGYLYPVRWEDVKPEHVIEKLQLILSGDLV